MNSGNAMNTRQIHRLVFGALFAAITCVATMVIRIPSFGPSGYINIGDTAVLLCAWILSGWYGACAAGIGSAMADLLSGYPIYVPGTFLIKFTMVLAVRGIHQVMTKRKTPGPVYQVISGVLAELIMVLGYLLYEAFFLGYGAAAVPAVAGNSIQGVTNLALAVAVMSALQGAKALRPVMGK